MPALTPAQVARKAKELLSNPDRWIIGDTAQDKFGNHVSTASPDARAFCAIGAVYHVCGVSDEMLQNKRDGLLVDKDARRIELAEKVIAELGNAARTMTEDEAFRMYPCTCDQDMTEEDLELGYYCDGCEERYIISDIVDLNDRDSSPENHALVLDAFELAYQDFLRAKLAKAS